MSQYNDNEEFYAFEEIARSRSERGEVHISLLQVPPQSIIETKSPNDLIQTLLFDNFGDRISHYADFLSALPNGMGVNFDEQDLVLATLETGFTFKRFNLLKLPNANQLFESYAQDFSSLWYHSPLRTLLLLLSISPQEVNAIEAFRGKTTPAMSLVFQEAVSYENTQKPIIMDSLVAARVLARDGSTWLGKAGQWANFRDPARSIWSPKNLEFMIPYVCTSRPVQNSIRLLRKFGL